MARCAAWITPACFASALTMLEATDGEQRSYLEIAEVIERYSVRGRIHPRRDLWMAERSSGPDLPHREIDLMAEAFETDQRRAVSTMEP